LAPKKSKGTELEVFSDRAGRANVAIFSILAKESPQTIKQISKIEGLEETYYASLTKRLHCLQETGYIREIKPDREDTKGQKSYELRIKAYLAMFLKENSMQEIFDQATDTQASYVLLTLSNVVFPEKDRRDHSIVKKVT
jgi:predicted transcriptional regulator